MEEFKDKLPVFEPGSVWLVGAGPGDVGLLTLLAHHALEKADILIYDALVGPDILDLTGPDCILEYAGKRGGKPSAKQQDISKRLVALAKEGKKVLRLKGGDPFIFGRGGEEALALVANDVPFRVVPGISSGVGGLAYAGIPITHRETNSSVTFVTGHDASGQVPENVNWQAVAQGSAVLVLFMAMKHIARISENLIRYGRPADEPVAIVVQATTDQQQVVETTLQNAAEDIRKSGIRPPALIVIGEVVNLRQHLDWYEALQGKALIKPPVSE